MYLFDDLKGQAERGSTRAKDNAKQKSATVWSKFRDYLLCCVIRQKSVRLSKRFDSASSPLPPFPELLSCSLFLLNAIYFYAKALAYI